MIVPHLLDGSDYQAVGPISLTFDRNTDSRDIMIPIIDDNIHEATEQFRGQLTTTEDPRILTLNPQNTNIQINDDKGMYTLCNA